MSIEYVCDVYSAPSYNLCGWVTKKSVYISLLWAGNWPRPISVISAIDESRSVHTIDTPAVDYNILCSLSEILALYWESVEGETLLE